MSIPKSNKRKTPKFEKYPWFLHQGLHHQVLTMGTSWNVYPYKQKKIFSKSAQVFRIAVKNNKTKNLAYQEPLFLSWLKITKKNIRYLKKKAVFDNFLRSFFLHKDNSINNRWKCTSLNDFIWIFSADRPFFNYFLELCIRVI